MVKAWILKAMRWWKLLLAATGIQLKIIVVQQLMLSGLAAGQTSGGMDGGWPLHGSGEARPMSFVHELHTGIHTQHCHLRNAWRASWQPSCAAQASLCCLWTRPLVLMWTTKPLLPRS